MKEVVGKKLKTTVEYNEVPFYSLEPIGLLSPKGIKLLVCLEKDGMLVIKNIFALSLDRVASFEKRSFQTRWLR